MSSTKKKRGAATANATASSDPNPRQEGGGAEPPSRKKPRPENGGGKRGGGSSSGGPDGAAAAAAEAGDDGGDGFRPMTLPQIRDRISSLRSKVPTVPDDGDGGGGLNPDDEDGVRDWARRMQAVIEELNLLLCCVGAATYRWGSDRSGAADQNLGLLSTELGNAQDQISSSVTPRLTNVLAPVVDLVIQRTVVTKNEGAGEGGGGHEEVKVNHFTRERVDPAFLRLCAEILCRNASMLRLVVLTNFHKIDRVIGDYIKATKKDAQHDNRGFAY